MTAVPHLIYIRLIRGIDAAATPPSMKLPLKHRIEPTRAAQASNLFPFISKPQSKVIAP